MDVRAHADYRAIIASWLREHPEVGARALAQGMGLRPSALAVVLRGNRKLEPVAAVRLARLMRLGEDGAYLVDLVLSESAPTPDERQAAASRVARARARRLG